MLLPLLLLSPLATHHRHRRLRRQLTALTPIKRLASSGLPFADALYTQPVSVDEVAHVAARCAAGRATAGVTARSPTDTGANVLEVEAILAMK
jgi:hypothetical protein